MAVLITGGTGGIGKELGKLFAKSGEELLLVSRDKNELLSTREEMLKIGSPRVEIMAIDLALGGSSKKIYEFCQDKKLQIEVLVNNAGFANSGRFWEIPEGLDENQIMLNVNALVQLTRVFLPAMVKRGSGKILNVASTAAFLPGPFMSVYYASKAFVLAFSLGLAEELEGSGVVVSTLCPGATKTGFAGRAGLLTSKLFGGELMTPEYVAKVGYEGLERGDRVVVTKPMTTWLMFGLTRLLPMSFMARVAASFQKPE